MRHQHELKRSLWCRPSSTPLQHLTTSIINKLHSNSNSDRPDPSIQLQIQTRSRSKCRPKPNADPTQFLQCKPEPSADPTWFQQCRPVRTKQTHLHTRIYFRAVSRLPEIRFEPFSKHWTRIRQCYASADTIVGMILCRYVFLDVVFICKSW